MEGRVFNPETGEAYDVDDVESAEKDGYVSAFVVGPDGKSYEMETIDDFKQALRGGYHVPRVAKLLQEQEQRDTPGRIESAARGFTQSGTMGFADEISAGVNSLANRALGGETDYEKLRDEYRKKDDLAWKNNPAYYGSGYAGAIVPALAATGPNILRVAAQPTMRGIAARVGENMAMSGIGGVGAAEEMEDVKPAQDLALGAGVSVVPNVVQGVKKLIPGTKGSLPAVNRLTTRAAGLFGMTPETQPTYERFLNDPEKYDAAMAAREDVVKKGEEYLQKATDLVETGKKNVSNAYQRLQAESALQNVVGPKTPGGQSFGEAQKDLVDSLRDARKFIALPTQEKFYAPATDKVLEKAEAVLTEGDPTFTRWLIKQAGITTDEAAKFDGRTLQRLAFVAIKKRGDAEAEKTFMIKMGKLFVEARRELDDALQGIKPGMGMTNDQMLVKELRDAIQDKAHGMLAGAKSMTKADKLYSEFKTEARPFAESLLTKGKADPKKVVRSLQNAGGDTAQVNLEIMLNRADEFYQKNAGTFTDAEKAAYAKVRDAWQKAGEPLADARNYGRMAQSVGATTGRSLAGLGAVLTGATLGGPGGAVAAAVLFPALNPVTWLAMLKKAREVGDTKTVRMLLGAAEKMSQASARQAGAVSENMSESGEPQPKE